jgi:acetoin utilization deacetylase AcuC-like enzyme
MVKVIFDEAFYRVYNSEPAATPSRIESVISEAKGLFEFVGCEPAFESNALLVYSLGHIERVKGLKGVYSIALLAIRGAIKAAEIALEGKLAFALIRPLGHHASRSYSWGFCYFNNVAIAIAKMLSLRRVKRVLIIDFDLHFGNGAANIFSGSRSAEYFHLPHGLRESQLSSLKAFFDEKREYGLLATSTSFDRHEEDWGGVLRTSDYYEFGKMLRESSLKRCGGSIFTAPEGGYNHAVSRKALERFLEGLENAPR